ncbi:MAG: hypothetical protein RB148_05970 [Armatimonadota bacterium]|nr:hypothetical protein [Armatimonadota bacterium]MDR7469649.1 hypothetical protein [Armatimonadota bacterium]
MNGGIRLGLSLPVFLGSLIAMFVGTFTGLLGIWLYLAWKIAVPEWIKVGHAHAACDPARQAGPGKGATYCQ